MFFALSGFLLWRSHAAAARAGVAPVHRSLSAVAGGSHHAGLPGCGRSDPDAAARRNHPNLTVWLANLSLTQIYVPLTLTAGLTDM